MAAALTTRLAVGAAGRGVGAAQAPIKAPAAITAPAATTAFPRATLILGTVIVTLLPRASTLQRWPRNLEWRPRPMHTPLPAYRQPFPGAAPGEPFRHWPR